MKIKSRVQLVLWAVLFVVTMSFSAYGADGQIKISQPDSFPIVIDQPGSYVLTSNITVPSGVNVHGIEVNTNNVTIDLNGHTIIGPGGYKGFGIYANNKNNITIMSGTLRNFHTGVRLVNDSYEGSNYTVKDIRAYNSSQGITVEGSGTITGCICSNGHTGFFCHKCVITNCTAKDNSSWGMGVSDSMATNCVVIHNGWTGIDATNSTITNCTVNSNHYNGTSSYGSGIEARKSVITNCTANNNHGNGVCAHDCSRIEGNNLRNNTRFGLYLIQTQNYAIKNSASDNASGNFTAAVDNYMPTSLTGADAANANIGW